jgi:glucosamine-6-phosphate isomerase
MKLNIYKDHPELSYHAARLLFQTVQEKPRALVCLATGETPSLTYAFFTAMILDQKIDVSQCSFIGLDEWVGIQPSNPGSCHHFLFQHIFAPLRLQSSQLHLFNALSTNLKEECNKMDDFIRSRGGIDVIVVGIGMNGHIGFNEPGVSPNLYAHVISLDEKTKTVGQKYFAEETSLSQGITLGLRHFLDARQAILLANGMKKAEIIRETLSSEISSLLPSTFIRKHTNGVMMLDEAAASFIRK